MLIFRKVVRRKFFKGIKVKGTTVIDAFVDIKMLSIFFLLKGMTTVRANKSNGFKLILSPGKAKITNFTQQLTSATGIVV
jgi:hypothetical protein